MQKSTFLLNTFYKTVIFAKLQNKNSCLYTNNSLLFEQGIFGKSGDFTALKQHDLW